MAVKIEKKNNIEVKNENQKCCFRYLNDEEIDKIMINRIKSSPKRGGKAKDGWTDEELRLRNSVVLDLLCNKGISRAETSRILQTRWGVGHTTSDRYIHAALDELVKDYDDFCEYNRVQHLQRLEGVLEDSLSHGDRKNALAALEQIAKINSLFLERKDININSDTISFDFQ